MVNQGTKIPPFYSTGCPRASHIRLFMDDDLCDKRGKRSDVLVEVYMQFCIPGNFGVHARLSENVERENCVWGKSAPEIKREFLVSTGKYSYEVLLEN